MQLQFAHYDVGHISNYDVGHISNYDLGQRSHTSWCGMNLKLELLWDKLSTYNKKVQLPQNIFGMYSKLNREQKALNTNWNHWTECLDFTRCSITQMIVITIKQTSQENSRCISLFYWTHSLLVTRQRVVNPYT